MDPPSTPRKQLSPENDDTITSSALKSPVNILHHAGIATPSIKIDLIPTLQHGEAALEMMPPMSPPFRGRDSQSPSRSPIQAPVQAPGPAPRPFYRNSNDSNGSLNSKRLSSSLNYVPSFSQPPPSHSHSNSQSSSTRRSRSPIRSKSPIRSPSPIRGSTSPIRLPNGGGPFNYKSQMFMMNANGSQNSLHLPNAGSIGGANSMLLLLLLNKRRGHRYKHSSVSMNLFQEPPKRAPLNVPQSFSIPTGKEILLSLNFEQKTKMVWCLLHSCLVLFNFVVGIQYNSNILLTLSHLCFYDVVSNFIVVLVDIMTNFECWNNSSLQYPFGLGRIEVLVGFGLSVSLIFVGGDLISHFLEELIVNLIMGSDLSSSQAEQTLHHDHSHLSELLSLSISSFHLEILIFLVISVTLISSNLLLPSSGASPELSTGTTSGLKLFNRNYLINSSTSILTLCYAGYSIISPLLANLPFFESLNDFATLLIALSICTMAWKLIKSLSYILLISYPYDNNSFKNCKAKLTQQIQHLDIFKSHYKIQQIVISKVNYKIFIVILQLQMMGCTDEDESRMRFYATKLIKNVILQEEIGVGDDDLKDSIDQSGSKFEITIEINK